MCVREIRIDKERECVRVCARVGTCVSVFEASKEGDGKVF